MYDIERHKKDEQAFWQAQFSDTQDSPIPPGIVATVTGGATMPVVYSPNDAAQLIQPSLEGGVGE